MRRKGAKLAMALTMLTGPPVTPEARLICEAPSVTRAVYRSGSSGPSLVREGTRFYLCFLVHFVFGNRPLRPSPSAPRKFCACFKKFSKILAELHVGTPRGSGVGSPCPSFSSSDGDLLVIAQLNRTSGYLWLVWFGWLNSQR